MNTKKYESAKIKKINLDDLYDANPKALEKLDNLLIDIINTEAPITMNILKLRLRKSFGVDRIREKAQTIIDERVRSLGFYKTNNLYDDVFWPVTGEFKIDYLREGFKRTIYDIPYQELVNLYKDIDLSGEELYREVLKYFGFEVLTKKARDYLEFVSKKL